MSQVWIQNLTINERPRSTQICAHCRKACIEAIPRGRLSFQRPDSGEHDSAHLHLACIAPFTNSLLKEHAQLYKDALKRRA